MGAAVISFSWAIPGPGAAAVIATAPRRANPIPVPSFHSRPPARLKRPACALRQRGGVNGFGYTAANVGKLATFQKTGTGRVALVPCRFPMIAAETAKPSLGSLQRVAGAEIIRPAALVFNSFHHGA
ncbi:hypothetical protein HNQ99_002668 [Rhizorhapis suberifaciens]|uniref:Uncharacterized protein n=1 Tax=Rhizorhapis suberifaciens TaxID=13656 RepID=A0A840HWK4_9SPHN|nr:hypothetical protein [Rhizorhapis suberifaciens]